MRPRGLGGGLGIRGWSGVGDRCMVVFLVCFYVGHIPIHRNRGWVILSVGFALLVESMVWPIKTMGQDGSGRVTIVMGRISEIFIFINR